VKINYQTGDVNLAAAFLKPLVNNYQLSEDAYKSIIATLRVSHGKAETELEALLTIRDACLYLKISKPTLYALIRKKQLKLRKIGKCSRLLQSDVYKLVND